MNRVPSPIGYARERGAPLVRRVGGPFLRGLGAPSLFGIALSTVGASIYYVLGVVAGDAKGLTPVVFLIAGVFFALTMATYVEGNSVHPERGGASTFARYAFNELWSFIAGWAILLDYLIVMAIAALSVSHYLAAFWGQAGHAGVEYAIAAGAIAWVAWSNIRGLSAHRLRGVLAVVFLNLALLVAIVIAGLALVYEPGKIGDTVELGTTPEWDDLIFAVVVAGVALTGIEAASGVAGEIRPRGRDLRRVLTIGTVAVLTVFTMVSVIALMAVPVENGATELGKRFVEAPLLGVVSAYDSEFLSEALRYAVGGLGALVLIEAVNVNMLGLSRLAYSLATNRQIPSAVGKLHQELSTPYVTIVVASLLAFGLVLSGDIEFLAGIFAFGAMLAFAIAHTSVVVMRFREPDARRAYRIPLSVKVGRGTVPLPAALGAVAAMGAWITVIIFHEGARVAGSIWMLAGLTLYVIYRRGQDKSLTKRFTIPEAALKESRVSDYGSILVPVFGGPLDDDIVGTAGRLAAEEAAEGEGGTVIEAIYVMEIPMALPIDAVIPEERIRDARRTLARAKAVGEEYEGVEVAPATARARSLGAGIVEEARRRGVEAIVLAAERPTRMRGGALLGGRGGPRDRYVGETTRYVIEKAPCRVILTAPPADDEGERAGVAP